MGDTAGVGKKEGASRSRADADRRGRQQLEHVIANGLAPNRTGPYRFPHQHSQPSASRRLRENFFKATYALDEIRNESFEKTFPEISELLRL